MTTAASVPTWLAGGADRAVLEGLRILVGSTIIITCGIGVAALVRKREAMYESIVLRATLAAALLAVLVGFTPIADRLRCVSVPLPWPGGRPAMAAGRPTSKSAEARPGRAPGQRIDAPSLRIALAGAWAGISLLLGLRLALSQAFVRRCVRRARPAGAPFVRRCEELAGRLGVPVPTLLASARVRSPLLVGIRAPAIVLPEAPTAAESPEALDAVLLHELAHLKRRDVLWHFLGHAACAIAFFQPLLWILVRRLEDVDDQVCDDCVLQDGSGARAYARALLRWSASCGSGWRENLAAAGVVRFRSTLGRRIARLLDASRPRGLRVTRRAVLAAVTLIGASLGLATLFGVQAAGGPAVARGAPEARGAREKRTPRGTERLGQAERRMDRERGERREGRHDAERGERGEGHEDRGSRERRESEREPHRARRRERDEGGEGRGRRARGERDRERREGARRERGDRERWEREDGRADVDRPRRTERREREREGEGPPLRVRMARPPGEEGERKEGRRAAVPGLTKVVM